MQYGPPPTPAWGPPPQAWAPPAPTAPQEPFAFPAHLSMAPTDRRLDETFGWFPASFALAALFGALGTSVGVILQGGFDDYEQMGLVAGGFLLAPLFAFLEFWRRTHATSLVVVAPYAGVYRKGQLDQVVRLTQLQWFRLNLSNSLREYILFGVVGLSCPLGAVGAFAGGHFGVGLWCVGLGVGSLLAFASSVWCRGMCLHYYVPKGEGTETLVIAKSKLRQLGSWPFPI